MLGLKRDDLAQRQKWENAEIKLPEFDIEDMQRETSERPVWVHFGAGNIFRGYIAALQQELLEKGLTKAGIVAAELYDFEIIDRIYKPYNNLSLVITAGADGLLDKKVIASISEGLKCDPSYKEDWERLCEIFSKPSLQMATFTITEKGYNLYDFRGEYLPDVKFDINYGPESPKSVMGKVTALAYKRFKSGCLPIAFVSLDNCSRNGERLFNSIIQIANEWVKGKLIEEEFIEYLNDSNKVSFPWSMIDKIVPRPSYDVKKMLDEIGFVDMDIICTGKNTYIAPFVNTERSQYLVIEDTFPNGRQPLDKAGVFMSHRKTVEDAERMKVQTCLNPLHTALAIFGCLLGFKTISDEVKDECLRKLIEKIGYDEGMAVVVDPGIIDPKKYLHEVIYERFPNRFIPDTPQRIATDTSQKMPIRFGETIKAYHENPDLDIKDLKAIPLVIAGWCRYLMGIDDKGEKFCPSPDPLLESLMGYLKMIKLGKKVSNVEQILKPILSNKQLFRVDLFEVGLADRVIAYFEEMIEGIGSVRRTLEKYVLCR